MAIAFARLAQAQIETLLRIAFVAGRTAFAGESNVALWATAFLNLVGALSAQIVGGGNVHDDLLEGALHGAGRVRGLDVDGIDLAKRHQQMLAIGHLAIDALPGALNDGHRIRAGRTGADGRFAIMDKG